MGSNARVDLLAQPEHEHVDDVGLRIEAVIPDVRQDHRLRHHPAGVAHQVFEQRELARRAARCRAPAARDPARQQVERQIADGQVRRLGAPVARRISAWTRASSSAKGERLGQVVVAAGLQPLHAVVDGAPRAQNQHRRSHLPPPHRRRSRPGRRAWAASGRRSRRRTRRSRRARGRLAVGGVIDRESRLAQPARHELRDRDVVFDDDRTHFRLSAIRLSASAIRRQLPVALGHPGTLAPLALWHTPWHFGTLARWTLGPFAFRLKAEATVCQSPVPSPQSPVASPQSRVHSPESPAPSPSPKPRIPSPESPNPESRAPSPEPRASESRAPSPEPRIPNPESYAPRWCAGPTWRVRLSAVLIRDT